MTQQADQASVLAGPGPRLVDPVEVRLLDRLEADREKKAAALRGEIEELLVLGDLDRALAAPAHPFRGQRAEQLLRVTPVGDRVVVHEQDVARAPGAHPREIAQHLADRPHAVGRLVELGDAAVLAAEPAAARDVQRELEVVVAVHLFAHQLGAPERQVVEVRLGEPAQVVLPAPFVDALAEYAALEIGQQLGPGVLGLPLHHHVAMFQRLLRVERDPRAPHDDWQAARAVVVRQIVRPADLQPHRRDADQLGVGLQGRLAPEVVHQLADEIARRQRLEVDEGEPGGPVALDARHAAAALVVRSGDQQDGAATVASGHRPPIPQGPQRRMRENGRLSHWRRTVSTMRKVSRRGR